MKQMGSKDETCMGALPNFFSEINEKVKKKNFYKKKWKLFNFFYFNHTFISVRFAGRSFVSEINEKV